MEKGSVCTVDISGYTSEGAGIARVGGQIVFVPLAILGETCRIKIVKVTKSIAYARLIQVIRPSPERIESECRYFPVCGGCKLWHMTYDEELKFKEGRVRDAIERIAGIDTKPEPIIGARNTRRYRNKAQFPVGRGEIGAVSGFYRVRSHDIVPSDVCLIQSAAADKIRGAVLQWQEDFDVPVYDEARCRGVLRHIYVRNGEGGALLCIVAAQRPKHLERLCEYVMRAYPSICGIVLNINSAKTNVILGDGFETIYGDGYTTDKLCGLKFRISPAAFYQVNRDQAEKLYDIAIGHIAASGARTVLDLYCGIGTITLCMARRIERVIGVETVASAIDDARENCRLNGIGNAEFICADAGDAMKELAEQGIIPDAVLVDPPRKGLAAEVIDRLKELAADTLVYVSCDPGTLARDLKLLCADTYKVQSLQPVDMFPRTHHVECVVLMSRVQS